MRCSAERRGKESLFWTTWSTAENRFPSAATIAHPAWNETGHLSTCDSGSGEVKIGEGVMSLRRVFPIAGAETVLARHWRVKEKAISQPMTEFIRRWHSGEPRAQAFREAPLSCCSRKIFQSYFWGRLHPHGAVA